MSYSTNFTGEMVGGGLVEVRMDYYSTDPLALHLTFIQHNNEHVARWQLSRDLVVQGMASTLPVGEGDVQVVRGTEPGVLDEDMLEIALTAPGGVALLLLPLVDVSRFVGRTLVEMPLGDELVDTSALPETADPSSW